MGAVSFQDVEPMKYKHIYYHDYHGWRNTMKNCKEAFNAFTASDNEILQAVSFYTAVDNVAYTIKIFDSFKDGKLQYELSNQSGIINYTGFHTIDLDKPIGFTKGDDFYIYLKLSKGGQPIDCTSKVTVLLGSKQYGTIVKSTANFGESFLRAGFKWIDLHYIRPSANFCIKGLSNPWIPTKANLECNGSLQWENVRPGKEIIGNFFIKNVGEPLSSLDWEIVKWPKWGEWDFEPVSMENLKEGKMVKVNVKVVAPEEENALFNGEIKVVNKENESDFCIIPIHLTSSRCNNFPLLHLLLQYFPFLKMISNYFNSSNSFSMSFSIFSNCFS